MNRKANLIPLITGLALLAAVSALPAFAGESSRADFEEFVEMVEGRWIGEVTFPSDLPGFGKAGEKVTAYWDARITDDGNVLIGKYLAGPGSSTSIIYYDAGAKAIRWVFADSGGGVQDSVVYRSNGKWMEKIQGSLADGTKMERKATLTISEDGAHIWEGSGTVGGEETAPQRDVWRRVSQ